jgi:hypothetical protein
VTFESCGGDVCLGGLPVTPVPDGEDDAGAEDDSGASEEDGGAD